MANEDVVSLSIEYDNNSVQSANTVVDSMRQQLDRVSDSADQLGVAGQAAASRLQSAFAGLRGVVDDTDSSISDLRVQMRGAVVEANNLQQASSAGGSGGISGLSSALRVGSQLVGSGTAAGGVLRTAGEIARLQTAFDHLSDSLPQFVDGLTSADSSIGDLATAGGKVAVALGATAGGAGEALGAVLAVSAPLIIAISAIGVGLKVLSDQMATNKTVIDEAISQQDAYYKAIQTGTTDSINKEIQLDTIRKNALDQQIKDTQAAITNAQAQAAALDAQSAEGGGGGLAGFRLSLEPAFKDLQTKLNDLQKQSDATAGAIQADSDALKSQSVAANDAAAAQDAQAKQNISDLNKQAQLYLQDQQMKTQSVASIQKVIDANDAKLAVDNQELLRLHDLANATEYGSSAWKIYNAEIQKLITANEDLNAQTNDLTKNILPAASATEDFKNSIKSIGAVLSDTAKQADGVVAAFKAVSDAAAKEADVVAATNAARALQDSRAQTDFDTNRLNEINSFNQAQLQKDAQFAQSQADQLVKLYDSANQIISTKQATALKDSQAYARQQHDNALKLAEQIQQITNQANASELDAAYKLDAHGVENAKRQAATQITNLTTTYNDQKAISDRNEQQKLQDMADQATQQRNQQLAAGLQSLADQKQKNDEQRTQAQQAENQKLADQKAAFDLASRRRDEDRRIQDAARDKAYKDQQAALGKHLSDMLTTQTTGQKAISDSFSTWWGNLVANAKANTPTQNPVTGVGMPGTYTAGNGGGAGGGVPSASNSIGVQFANGVKSFATTVASFLGSFDVGTGLQGTSRDGLAKLHKGEIVLDPTTSDSLRKGLGIRGVDSIGSGTPSTSNMTGITMGTVNITQHFSVTGSDMSLDKMKPIIKQAMTSVLQDLTK